MRLHLLGSSAGKPIPRPFCSCRVCQTALRQGGKDVRTRTGLAIYPSNHPPNGTQSRGSNAARDYSQDSPLKPVYQVDLSPDYVHQVIRDKIDTGSLEHLLITHPDGDHFHWEYLNIRRTIRSSVSELPILNIYGNHLIEEVIDRNIKDLSALRCRFHKVADGDQFNVGSLRVTAFQAMHRGPRCLHYAVDDGRYKVLLAWDGMWDEDVWQRLSSWRFDAIGMECTHLGPSPGPLKDHLNLDQFLQVRDRMLQLGMMDDGTRLFAVHIGDNGGLTYGEAQELAGKAGFIVGYDGMMIDLSS